eukprot:931205-Rhodomonas_salina.1
MGLRACYAMPGTEGACGALGRAGAQAEEWRVRVPVEKRKLIAYLEMRYQEDRARKGLGETEAPERRGEEEGRWAMM